MTGRGQAIIGIWPKSYEYSRCLGITWNAKATIGTFCSDFVVRDCFYFRVATTLFFPFSKENKLLIEMAPFLFVDTSFTNGTGLCTKIQPYGTCPSGANAAWPHELRAQNDATISPGADNTTISWHMSLTNGISLCTAPLTLRYLYLWVVPCFAFAPARHRALFSISSTTNFNFTTFQQVRPRQGKHTVASLARQAWTAHGTLP